MTDLQSESEQAAAGSLPSPASPNLRRILFEGSSALGLATLIERGFSFIANLAAARIGGASVFGAYSVAMTTANNVASYAGAGIGTTANRFSGEYPYGSAAYAGLVRTLAIVSLASAAVATGILWLAAGPLATRLLLNPSLAHILRLAAFSSGAIILLECLRGLLVGQRRFTGLLALSVLFGGGLAITLPVAARHGAYAMVLGQATIALSAILVCVLAARKLRFAPPALSTPHSAGPRPGSIVRFGLIQLAGMIGVSAAGWWAASLVARADISLAQAGWYSAAMQLRNMSAMPAWLISQTAYAQLTEKGGQRFGGAGRVTLLSTLVATAVSLTIAGPAAALMPWIVPHLYGKDFANAELAATLAVATGLVHMSAAPAAARLTVVSLPLTGIVNGIWSLLLIGLASWLVPHGGAAEATACFLGAHLFSAVAVLLALLRMGSVPRELAAASVPGLAGSILIACLGLLRATGNHKSALSAAMLAVTACLLWLTFYNGRKTSAAIRDLSLSGMAANLMARLNSRFHV
jgi:O-antigen/teichoic acid export membrane protein